MRALLLTVLGVAVAGCRPDPRITMPVTRGPAIGTITLEWSNVHGRRGVRLNLLNLHGARP